MIIDHEEEKIDLWEFTVYDREDATSAANEILGYLRMGAGS